MIGIGIRTKKDGICILGLMLWLKTICNLWLNQCLDWYYKYKQGWYCNHNQICICDEIHGSKSENCSWLGLSWDWFSVYQCWDKYWKWTEAKISNIGKVNIFWITYMKNSPQEIHIIWIIEYLQIFIYLNISEFYENLKQKSRI